MAAGRPTLYSKEMHDNAKEYIDNYRDHEHVIPSVVGMAVVLGVNKTTLYQWVIDERGEEGDPFSNTLSRCEDMQHIRLLNGGLSNELNPTITKLALANHGYSERTATEHTGANGGPMQVLDVSQLSDEELRDIIGGSNKP